MAVVHLRNPGAGSPSPPPARSTAGSGTKRRPTPPATASWTHWYHLVPRSARACACASRNASATRAISSWTTAGPAHRKPRSCACSAGGSASASALAMHRARRGMAPRPPWPADVAAGPRSRRARSRAASTRRSAASPSGPDCGEAGFRRQRAGGSSASGGCRPMRSANQALAASSKALAAATASRCSTARRHRGPQVSSATAVAASRPRSRPLLASPVRGSRKHRMNATSGGSMSSSTCNAACVARPRSHRTRAERTQALAALLARTTSMRDG
eukprot:11227100-Lingulodinium_polyedra.AAC.4